MKKVKNVKHRSCGPTKNLKLSVFSLFALCVLVIAIVLSGCSNVGKQTVDLNNYVVAIPRGYDGYGSVTFDIDYDRMIGDVDATRESKQSALNLTVSLDPLVASYNESNELHNGDVVEISWKRNDRVMKELATLLDVKFTNDNFDYTVNGLAPVKDYNPFDDLVVTTNHTISGNGEIKCEIHCDANDSKIIWPVSHDAENGAIKNGDVLNLTINATIDEDAFARQTGLRVTNTFCQYKVACLAKPATDLAIFDHIGAKETVAFNKVIDDWVVAALNDENLDAEKRTYELCGYMYYVGSTKTADNQEQESGTDVEANETFVPNDGMLVAIYKVYDPFVSEGYYVFVGLKGVFSYDNDGVYINNGEYLPNSFVYYEKETVRYSESRGWGQGHEAMGFLRDGLGYAGHLKLQETIGYLDKTYGEFYDSRYITNALQNMLDEEIALDASLAEVDADD